jgi:amino acid adenylation domain-containing protein
VPESSAHGLQDLVARWVRREPEACAVRESATGGMLTYRELWRRSGRLAGHLAARGVRRGDVVAVAAARSIDLVVALLGIVRAGAAYLPLDGHSPTGRLAAITDEAAVDLVVCSAARSAGEDRRRGRLPSRLRRVPVPGPAPAGSPPPLVTPGGDDPVYVAYTSGSTGRPKGVVVPHRAVLRLVVAPTFCTIAPGDRVANTSDPAFDATTFEIWNTLTAGATVVVLPSVTELTLDTWADVVRTEAITTMFLTTSLFHLVAREAPAAFRGLHTVVVGGEQMDLAAARRVLDAGGPRRLVNGYGPTETTTFASYFDCTADSLAGLDRVPIGHPLQDTTLYVLDDELRPVAPGEPGELCVGGPGVATGYLCRPELTSERFVRAPSSGPDPASRMYRTGDVVRQLPGGALTLLGRRDRQVKLRGFRIEPEEIERALTATGLVDSAFVEKAGDGPAAYLVGFVLPARDADSSPAAIAAALATRVPAYMIPSRWLVLDELPLGPTGKVDRARLLARVAAQRDGAEPPAEADAPDPVAGEVARIWRDVLGVRAVRPDDNFLDLGGNSILAIQVASRLRARLLVEVEPADVLLAETLADLTLRVGDAEPAAATTPERGQRS